MKHLLSRIIPPPPLAASRRSGVQPTKLPGLWFRVIAFVSLLSGSLFAEQFGDFTYTVSGTQVTITGYPKTAVGVVLIPSAIDGKTVIGIGSLAFSQCLSITSVTIPQGVTSIGGSVFSGCVALTSVTLPQGATSIGGSAFYGCTSLTSVTIP